MILIVVPMIKEQITWRKKTISKRPFLLFAFAFLAGILNRIWGVIPAGIFFIVICIGGIAPSFMKKQKRKVLVMLTVLGSVFLFSILFFEFNVASRCHYLEELSDGKSVTVWGKINKIENKNDTVRYYLSDCQLVINGNYADANKVVDKIPIEKLMVYYDVSDQNTSQQNSCGDEAGYIQQDILQRESYVEVVGKVNNFASPSNEGAFDSKTFYQSQRIDFCIYADAIRGVMDTQNNADNFARKLNFFSEMLSQNINQSTDESTAGVLNSMILGDKELLQNDTKELYQSSGISHILAISGLHISIIGMALYRFLRNCRRGFLSAMCISVSIVMSYSYMTGNSVSTQRAVGMFVLSLLASYLGRTTDLLNSLGLVCLVMMIDNPFVVQYTGYIFSVLAIFTIAVVVSAFSENQKQSEPDEQERFGTMNKSIRNKIFEGIALQLGLIPIVACVYYEISIYSVFINMIVLPLLPIVFVSGLLAGICGSFSILLSKILIFPAWFILKIYNNICDFFLQLPGARLIVGKPAVEKVIIYYLMLLLTVFILHRIKERRQAEGREKEGRQTKRRQTTLKFLFTSCLIIYLIFPSDLGFEIDVLDVGQGDGIYYHSSSGQDIFIDGGSASQKNLGQYTIIPFLKSKGVKSISYWFVSHADEDHISGLLETIELDFDISNIVIPDIESEDENLSTLEQMAKEKNINIIKMHQKDSISFDENISIEILYPKSNDSASYDRNDNCLVLMIKDNSFSGIFAGDISREVEQQIISDYNGKLHVDFYKTNHHGSNSSTSTEWLDAITPQIATISCGKNNRYGHPHKETIENMENSNIKVFRTDEVGQIKIRRKGNVIVVSAPCSTITLFNNK